MRLQSSPLGLARRAVVGLVGALAATLGCQTDISCCESDTEATSIDEDVPEAGPSNRGSHCRARYTYRGGTVGVGCA